MIRITQDLLGIAERLREIDSDYCAFYNSSLDRFEIHCDEAPSFLTLCLVADSLDNRLLERAMKTRKENLDENQAEMDSENARIENAAFDRLQEASHVVEDMLSFANSTSLDVIFSKPEWY